MATQMEPVEINVPSLPAKHDQFIQYVAAHPKTPMLELLEPYKQYDTELRKLFAQQPDHPAIKQPNVVPVFAGQEKNVTVRARSLKAESEKQRDQYIMPLKDDDRKTSGSPAIVQSLQEFKTNFSVFAESSLADLDWSNVIVAGSAVVTSLLSVPKKYAGSKRALREYYHEKLAPASDVDLFLYGLTEEQAQEKIKQVERNIRDAILVETTTVRTKNAITIASQYPTRHVQVVLRIYKSISEILTGFDVDCSCAAFDGKQVWASPRALAAYMTQTNTIDLTRRSPSYENRLSKYSHRGFEVYWPLLDRSKIDPTIFERSFGRTEGLARLLILEKLPKSGDREAYLDQRRAERGRPAINRWRMHRRMVHGNIKNNHEDEVAEWVDSDEVSDYHTFTIPYGPTFHAKKIEKLLYTKDLLLNAEWNKPKGREVNLHRHPAFFGTAEDVMHDCCGYCPKPATIEEEEVAEEESKIYIKGDIAFIKDDPGRQAIGSFNPLNADDWTEMAYVGNTAQLCKAIVDGDLQYVEGWLDEEGNDPNTRDYTGRTPLHLAVVNSAPEMVQCLIDHDARLVARLVDGKTALHLAAIRGNVDIVSALLRRSEANEEEEAKKVDARREAREAAQEATFSDAAMKDVDKAMSQAKVDADEEGSDVDMMEDADEDDDEDMDATTEGSMVNVKTPEPESDDKALNGEDEDEPDVYDVNVLAWDTAVSPLHLAIVKGHVDVVKCLVQDFGADVLLPVKLFNDHDKSARAAILTVVLALQLPMEKAEEMTRTLLQLGASSAQADMDQKTVLQYTIADRPDIVETLVDADKTGFSRAINHLSVSGYQYIPSISGPLIIAIQARDSLTALQLLTNGAKPEITFDAYTKAYQSRWELQNDSTRNKQDFGRNHAQPVVNAVNCELPQLAKALVEQHGVDPNTLTPDGFRSMYNDYTRSNNTGESLLDLVKGKLRALREWKPEEQTHNPPTPLKDDSEYLSDYEEGTYAHWSACQQLQSAKDKYERDWKDHVKVVKGSQKQTGVEEKQAAVYNMIEEFRKLEVVLKNHGAKTFKELHPTIKEPEKQEPHNYRGYEPEPPKPFGVAFKFNLGDLNDEAHAKYMQIFEAAWQGDFKTLKEMTLSPWHDAKGEEHPPLKVAVADRHNLSPFSIAVLNGRFSQASGILEITRAQYQPYDAPKQKRYTIDEGSDDEEVDDDDDNKDVRLRSDIVDDQFTVENIGEVSMQVKSRVTPLQMMLWRPPIWNFFESEPADSNSSNGSNGVSYLGPRKPYTLGKRTNTGSIKLPDQPGGSKARQKDISKPADLIRLAIYNGDSDMLSYLLGWGHQYTRLDADPQQENGKSFFSVDESDFVYAIELDRPHIVAQLIKETGAGIPLNALVKKSGVEIKERPKYYQGLSVYGKKRKDWADQGRYNMSYEPVESQRPPFLEACHSNALECAEWFLSDAPIRCYQEFAEANKDDKRIQRLTQSAEGFEASTKKFLGARSRLAIHCCVMGKPTPEAIKLLRYLLKAMPDTVNVKSADGLTPLQIAFELGREEEAKILLQADADQTCRDKLGNNLLHSLLARSINSEEKVKHLPVMLDIIDKRLLSSMVTERSSSAPGSLTPLAFWLNSVTVGQHYSGQHNGDTLRTILSYSKGAELSMINGEGDTPLHVTVRHAVPLLTEIILKHSPQLLNRENATGRTPFEMAEDAAIAAVCENPPPMPSDGRHRLNNRQTHRNVLDRSNEGFVENEPKDTRNHREMIWDMLRDAKASLNAEGQGKRRLVTLNEANEVARRLATMNSGHSSGRRSYEAVDEEQQEQEAGDVSDEVQAWLSSAQSHL